MAATTQTIQDAVDFVRTMPSMVPVLGIGGASNQPALGIAQAIIRKILAPSLPWKWNRAKLPPIYLGALQQDYVIVPAVTNLGWLERGSRVQTIFGPNMPPPTWPIEVVRDLPRAGSSGTPTKACWIPAGDAITGTWAPNTTIATSKGQKQLPTSALTQITDSNGNIQVATAFGTTGATEPVWATVAGTTTADGTVVWTMADPNSIAIRLDYLMQPGGNAFTLYFDYQGATPVYTSLSDLIGIPDDIADVFNEGLLAGCMRHAGDARWEAQEQKFLAMALDAAGAADREPSSWRFVPEFGPLGYW